MHLFPGGVQIQILLAWQKTFSAINFCQSKARPHNLFIIIQSNTRFKSITSARCILRSQPIHHIQEFDL